MRRSDGYGSTMNLDTYRDVKLSYDYIDVDIISDNNCMS